MEYEEQPEILKEPAREIIERITEGFYTFDFDWRLLYVNGSAEAFWGRRREDLIGKSRLSLFPQFADSRAHAAHQEAFDRRTHVRVEAISTATGLPVELNLYPEPHGLSVDAEVDFRGDDGTDSDPRRFQESIRHNGARRVARRCSLASRSAGLCHRSAGPFHELHLK